jgi:oxygen-independent coproporphyrinogen-3 oxidase
MHISTELLQRFDVPGPRYTSYPTADRFVDAYGEAQYVQALDQRRLGARAHAVPLSLYVHIPFCASLCYYCACNKVITGNYGKAVSYLHHLKQEIQLLLPHLGHGQSVSQLHFGGGTPTYFKDPELIDLMTTLKSAFQLQPGGEFSIEVDPRTVDAKRLQTLFDVGFNRLSLGVQDFDPQVQVAVHREQSAEQVKALMHEARWLGFESINLDLIYGLPMQTEQSWARTLATVVDLKPDRVALYGYAHLPARFKPQRHIDASTLPNATQKTAMLAMALAAMQAAGYVYIGMDHFALPQDALSIAKRQGRLHRNFQGYSTQPDCDLVSLGVSSIGSIGANYVQNAKQLDEYEDLLNQGRLPVVRGIALSRDDLTRRSIIMALMCQGQVDFESIESAHLLNFKDSFAQELRQLQPMTEQGLVRLTDQAIEVTALGWYFVRAIAMVFDRYVQSDQQRSHFSKIL